MADDRRDVRETYDAIAEHFAFEHTRDMQRILKDRTAV